MADRQQPEVLDREQCLGLLRTVRVGRLVFVEDCLPAVQPVNFRLKGDHVVIRVAGGAKLAAATGNTVVAFQADELEPDLRTGWSVTVVGHANLITDVTELVDVSGTWLEPWVDGRREHFIRIQAEKVTGRRLRTPVTTTAHRSHLATGCDDGTFGASQHRDG
ncbi:pyridoxamine 5'-phosphate oxidase family protein [Amycolatopsis sp. NPDC049868]|uniref:pyridoxamine 5'-phosphate oxidase family protein n=1 Tax=Amycolatopsis sp. NPDC049868 TaxID=3363934 RepID=UPI00378DD136